MFRSKPSIFVLCCVLFAITPAFAQDVDGTLGQEIAVELSTVGSDPIESDIGDLFVISLPAKDVKRVTTDIVPEQGDAVRRVALVKVGDTIVAYYSAERVGSALIQFEITRLVGGVTSKTSKIVAVRVNESQQFNEIFERDLDGQPDPKIPARIGDVIRIKKKKAGLTDFRCGSGNSSIVRRDAVVDDGTVFTYVFTVVGKGTTNIVASWATPGKDFGFIFVKSE